MRNCKQFFSDTLKFEINIFFGNKNVYWGDFKSITLNVFQ